MRLFEWSDEFTFGIDEIDCQHRWLVEHINDFYEQYKTGASDEAILTMLDVLLEYMKEHFDSEEGYLERHGYPELDRHKKEHFALASKVYDLDTQFRQTGSIPLDEFAGFLIEWLYGHIKKVDARYVEYFRTMEKD